jgi:hypothetical protein
VIVQVLTPEKIVQLGISIWSVRFYCLGYLDDCTLAIDGLSLLCIVLNLPFLCNELISFFLAVLGKLLLPKF